MHSQYGAFDVAHLILASTTASITELKRNPMATVAAGEGRPVAILNRNEPSFYCVPAAAYEALLERLENMELNALADARLAAGETPVKVSIREL
nr:type II toxin-antitoxin system Phd/YefM family antitoxin [Piscinibacter lacus]